MLYGVLSHIYVDPWCRDFFTSPGITNVLLSSAHMQSMLSPSEQCVTFNVLLMKFSHCSSRLKGPPRVAPTWDKSASAAAAAVSSAIQVPATQLALRFF